MQGFGAVGTRNARSQTRETCVTPMGLLHRLVGNKRAMTCGTLPAGNRPHNSEVHSFRIPDNDGWDSWKWDVTLDPDSILGKPPID
jgi:hypothetical protein